MKKLMRCMVLLGVVASPAFLQGMDEDQQSLSGDQAADMMASVIMVAMKNIEGQPQGDKTCPGAADGHKILLQAVDYLLTGCDYQPYHWLAIGSYQDLAKRGFGCDAALRHAITAPQVAAADLMGARMRVELLQVLVELGYVHAYRAAVVLAEEFCKKLPVPREHVPTHFVKLLLEELLKREDELLECGAKERGHTDDEAEGEASQPSADELFDGENIIERARAALVHPRLQSPQ